VSFRLLNQLAVFRAIHFPEENDSGVMCSWKDRVTLEIAKEEVCRIQSGNENTDGLCKCLEMKSCCEKLLKEE